MAMIEYPGTEICNYTGEVFNLTNLWINQYYLILKNSMTLFTKNDECEDCPFIEVRGSRRLILDSKYQEEWRVVHSNDIICNITPKVGEFGVYSLNESCHLETICEPVNIYLPILTVILIFSAVAACLYLFFWALDKYILKKEDADEGSKKERIRSLDTFRGISIILMIFVNSGGGGYNFFDHAIWNGLTLADLVFPWFLWIMGVCIPMSLKSALNREEGRIEIFLNILRRSVILFILGLAIGPVYEIKYLRVFGVLQRFSICYFVVAVFCLLQSNLNPTTTKIPFEKLVPQWAFIILIVLIHSLCTFFVPIPNCPEVGYLGPSGMHKEAMYVNCTAGGTAGYVDNLVLGHNHLYQKATFVHIFYGKGAIYPFDPEGFFSTMLAIVQVFLGVQAGAALQLIRNKSFTLICWIVIGVALGLIGGGLCGFTKNDGVIPLNKNLWSLSFTCVTSALAFLLLAALYFVIDIMKWWSGKPFLFAGMNAIILYIGHSIVGGFPFRLGVFAPYLHFQLLTNDVWCCFMWVLVAYWLYRIKYFLSI